MKRSTNSSAQIRLKEYNTASGYFSIPIFFYGPGSGKKPIHPEIIQQIDIMPSILGLLHYDKPYVAFGRNTFGAGTYPFAFNYLDNVYQSFSGNYLLQFDGTKSIALYDFKQDRLLIDNLVGKYLDTVRVMENRLKAFIQQYDNRMVDDRLTIDGPLMPSKKK